MPTATEKMSIDGRYGACGIVRTDLLRSTASSNSEKTPLSLEALIIPDLSGVPPEELLKRRDKQDHLFAG